MSKSMMGSAGGGKVTVEGLTADVILAGNTVNVLQGVKEIAKVDGKLDILLLAGGVAENNGTSGYLWMWNGSTFSVQALRWNTSYTFSGIPLYAVGAVNHDKPNNLIGGNRIVGGHVLNVFNEFTNNVFRTENQIGMNFELVVLGRR